MPRSVQSAKSRATPQLICPCGHAKGWHSGFYRLTCDYPECGCREYRLDPYDCLYESPALAAEAFWSQF